MSEQSRSQVPPFLILGVGNVLLRDEGVGCRVAEEFLRRTLSPDIEVIDGGTMGMELMWHLEGREKVVVIDVVRAGEPPGTIFRFRPDEIQAAHDPKTMSFHQLGFLDILKVAPYTGTPLPDMVIIAVEPKDISIGDTLTPEIEAKVPTLIEQVMSEINNT